jgi:hypothetical protein
MLRKFTAFVPRYRKFESISLQQRVRNELCAAGGDRVPSVRSPFRRRVYRATAWRCPLAALPTPPRVGRSPPTGVRNAGVLRSRLQNHVEGRLRRAPDALEAARADNLAKPCLASLRAERRTDLLR